MQNYKELFTLSNLDAINALYDSIPANELPKRIKSVCDYLREGYKYASNVDDDRVRKMDITVHTELIHTLHIMASEMNKPKDHLGFTIRHESGCEIALEPFFDFCEIFTEEEWIDLVDNLDELRTVLSNYLNDSNVWAYKECVETISYIHEMMSSFNTHIQNA
jgi:hypothetical protein